MIHRVRVLALVTYLASSGFPPRRLEGRASAMRQPSGQIAHAHEDVCNLGLIEALSQSSHVPKQSNRVLVLFK
jgi:hypothetical protein